MFLKQLEINGFKSFLGKIELNFTNGINAIVGPNGSGKSNIADAIRWVIGEQSVKTLRGNRMEDIIFSGSEKMKAAGFAEVTIVLDNTDKGIDLDYNEISVTRRMFRSGESEYYLNKTQCRLKDLTEIFMDTGVGKDGYSIIGQGKIDEILSNKSDDRRAIFEEASGISKYKYRKLESEKKMERTEQNIIRIQDILQEVESQLEPLLEQAETTKKYQKYLHELKTLDVNLIVSNIDRSNKRLDNIKNEIKMLNDNHEQKSKLLQEIENSREKNRIEIKNLESEIGNLNQNIYELINKKEKSDGELRVYREKASYIDGNIKKLSTENNELLNEININSASIEDNKKEQRALTDELGRVGKFLRDMESEYKERYSSIANMEDIIEKNKQRHIEYLNKQSDIKSSISGISEIIKNINSRIKQINNDSDSLNMQHEEKIKMKSQIEKDIVFIKEELAKKNNIEELFHFEKNQKENKMSKTEEALIKIRSNKDNILSRLRLLEEMEKEYGGYNRTIKSILIRQGSIKNMVQGFRGVVGELVSVPQDYTTAIEAALGFAMQNIVIDCEEDAKKLINILKKNNMGKATFLPIASIKPKRVNSGELNKLKSPGFIGIAAELIRYNEEYKNIIYYLLGRTIIVDNMDTAIKLGKASKYEIKIVTLEGEIFSVGGAITGGSKLAATNTILSRKNQILQLRNEYKSVLKELDDLNNSLSLQKEEYLELDNKILKLNENQHNLKIEHSSINNKLIYINNDIELIQSKLEINEKDVADLVKDREEYNLAIETDKSKLQEMARENEILLEEISVLEESFKTTKYERDVFIKKLTDIKVKEAELKQQKNSVEGTLANLITNEANINNKINKNVLLINDGKNNLNYIKDKENDINNIMENMEIQLTTKQNELENLKKISIQHQKTSESIENRIKQCQIDISELQNSLYKNDLQKAKNEMEIESLEMKLLESYELNYNQAASYRIEKFNINKSVKRIEELKEKIKDLGTVNVNAVEEYERLNKRYTFLNSQLNDLKEAKESLIAVIEEVTNYMRNQFLSEFSRINENFNKVFVKLFGGGSAQVVLEDKENILESPIDIIVRPPNKKPQNLMLMSGGERALTAIALLFGILIMKPVPFCVLDEIDSALDDANVVRYANFLKELSKNLQFIIITHRKGSMEMADCLYGVSMQDTGTSVLLSVQLEDKVS
ncbi:MAG: chromosome segregation protein SMC [Firmicutes bacterium]|nr:chromosome segregation protein SMC [Bacillota bacterium]